MIHKMDSPLVTHNHDYNITANRVSYRHQHLQILIWTMFCVFPEPVKIKAWFYCIPIWEWYIHTGLVFRILLGSPLADAIAAATLAGVLYRSVDENTEHWWSDWVSWKSFFQASDICNFHGGIVSSWGDGMPNPNMHWVEWRGSHDQEWGKATGEWNDHQRWWKREIRAAKPSPNPGDAGPIVLWDYGIPGHGRL
jgi:hypothetical protein